MSQYIFNLPVPPLLPADVNIDNNTTRIMKTNTTTGLTITDRISVLSGGFISNLNDPVNNSDIATKHYVDTHTGSGPAGANTDIQISDGSGGFIATNELTFNGTTMIVNPGSTITNGTVSLTNGLLSNVTDPTSPQEGATKHYVDIVANGLEVITVTSDYGIDYFYTPSQVINTILDRQFTPNTYSNSLFVTDFFPSASDIITYLNTFSQATIGTTFKTIIRMPQLDVIQSPSILTRTRLITGSLDESFIIYPENNSIDGIVTNLVIVTSETILTIVSIITNITPGSEQILGYITENTFGFAQNASITDQGLLTSSFNLIVEPNNTTRNGVIIYPLVPTIFNSFTSVTYTYDDLQTQLIIRSLIIDTTDTFVTAATIATSDAFLMGSGTFRFFLQNTSNYTLTLSTPSDWFFIQGNSNVVPPLFCGAFLVSVNIGIGLPSCIVRTIGMSPLNG